MSQGKSPKVVIVGGGIGGLSVAIALRQVGIEATVFERATERRKIEVGGGFTMWPNSMKALRVLEMEDKVREAGASFEEAEFRNWRGKHIARWPVTKMAQKYDATSACIDRADLVRVLADELDDQALCLGYRCTGFTQDDTGVTVQFANGQEVRGDILIAADGLNSVIRNQIRGKREPQYAGYILWQGYVMDPKLDPTPQGLFRVAYGCGKRFVFHHVGQNRLFWQSIATVPLETPEPPVNGKKPMLLERHRGWLEPTEQVLQATDETTISRMDVFFLDPIYEWGQGRVTFVGDAAHPILFNLGQGAAQTAEDAVILARHLSGNGDIVSALRSYEAQRVDRTTRIQNMAKRLGTVAQLNNPTGCFVRDQAMTVLFRSIVRHQQVKDMAFEL